MIALCEPYIKGNEWEYIKKCLDTNWVSSSGAYIDVFEKNFSEYVGSQSACVTVNGTAALEIALRVLGVGVGDEVIVPSMTFISPVNAIKYVGATPVFVDVRRDTFVMDMNKIEALVTPKTKAIIPVHLYGHPCDMDAIIALAKFYKLFVVEDATESLGSIYKGKPTGTIGDIGCFSFNGNKMITTGGGGMLVSNVAKHIKDAKYLTNQAKKMVDEVGTIYHEDIGYNYRMPNLLAAMGCAQLENLPTHVSIKIKNAHLYSKLLKDKQGITLPTQKEDCLNCNWLYSVVIEKNYSKTRDGLIKHLRENDIESRPFFYPVHLMPPYKDCKTGDMTTTIELWKNGVNLPSSVGLKKTEIENICDIL